VLVKTKDYTTYRGKMNKLKKHESKYLHIRKEIIWTIPVAYICWASVVYIFQITPDEVPALYLALPFLIMMVLIIVAPIVFGIWLMVREDE